MSLALLAGFGAALRAEDAAAKPEEIFPDTTIAAIALPDLEAARKSAGSTRIGEILKQPEMREFLDPILARMTTVYTQLRAGNPALPSLDDVDKGIFSGEIAVCVYSHGPGLEPGVALSIKPKDSKAFDTIINTAFKAVTHGQQDLPKDVPFPLGEGENVPGVLYSKGRFLLVKPMADMVVVAERIGDAAKRTKGTLASTPNFKEAQANMKDSAGWIYANPATLIAIAQDAAAAAKGGEESAKIKAVLEVMGVDKLSSLMVGVSFAGGEPNTEVYLGTTDAAPTKGIFSLVGTKGPSKDLFQIAALDAPYVAGGSFNCAGILPMIRSVLAIVDPAANAKIDEGMANVKELLKFDIQKDFLDNLGSDFVMAQTTFDTAVPLTMSPGLVGAMRVKDPAKIEECLAKLKTAADTNKLNDKIPAFYVKYDMAVYKGTKIYYISQLINGSAALCVVKDHLIIGNSLNAAKRGIDQMAVSSNILSSKDFQSAVARVGGAAFDADKPPLSFAYSTDMGSGGGMLLLTGLSVTAETAALAGIAEAIGKGKEVELDAGPPDLLGLGVLRLKPSGRAVLDVANSVDLNRWPDEEFFVKRRQSHASVGMKTAKGWFSRAEFPPPMPHYGNSALMVSAVAVVAAVAIPNYMRARNVAVAQAQAQAVAVIPPAAAGVMNNLRQLHLAMTLYETDHNALPKSPADLFPQYINDAAVFKNPAQPDQDVAFTMVTGVLSKDADALLAYENPPAKQAANGRNVLKTDGSVEHVSDADFKQLLKDTEEIITKAGRKFGTVPISVKGLSKKK